MRRKKQICFLLAMSLITSPIVTTTENLIYAEEEYVNVPDYNMKRALLTALASVHNTGRYDFSDSEIRNATFKKSELEKIKKINPELCVAHTCAEEGVKIVNLTGIEHCINLEDLSLTNQRVTDLDPIKKLTKLKKLELRNNTDKNKYIEDISALSELKDLEYLNLAQAKIKNTTPLSNLTKLKHLDLLGTKIRDLNFAETLVNLEYLDASLNYIHNVAPLENCKNLKVLKLSQNPTQANEEVKEKISNISILSHLTLLEELYLDNHNVTDVSSLQNLKALTNLTLLNNKVTNFEPTLVLHNLSKIWVLGNKSGLDNEFSSYHKAKEFFKLLNKSTLTKDDIKTIENLEKSGENIKNYFSNETLNKLNSIKEELKTKSLPFDAFNYLNSNGEIVSVDKLKGYKGSVGNDFLGRLPKNVEITVKKLGSNPVENEFAKSGIVELNEKEEYIVKVAIVDKDNRLIKEPIVFVSSKDGKTYVSENGYLTIEKSMLDIVQWTPTTFIIQSEKYITDKILKVTRTTPSKIGIYKAEFDVAYDKSDVEKLAIVKLTEKNSSGEPIVPPNPVDPVVPPAPTEKKDENIGIKNGDLYLKIVDEKGNLITEPTLSAIDIEGVSRPITAEKDSNYYVFKNPSEDYTWNIKFSSKNYTLKENETHAFSTSYLNGFTYINLNGLNLQIAKIEEKDAKQRDLYYTINVVSNNETPEPVIPPTPEPVNPPTPEVTDTEKDKNIGVKEKRLYFRVVDENKKLVTDEISITAKDTENFTSPLKAIQDGNYYYFDTPIDDYTWDMKISSANYTLKTGETHSFTTSFTKGFTHVGLNGASLSVDKIEEKDIAGRNAYYTINVVTKGNTHSNILLSPMNIISNMSTNINDSTAITFRNASLPLLTANGVENTKHNNETTTINNDENLIKTVVGINWNTENFKNEVGTYDLTGDLVLPEGITNPKNLKAKIRIIVKEKVVTPNTEAFGELIKDTNPQTLKIVIANEEKNIITEPIVVTDGTHSYISKDGYVEIPVLNGNHKITVDDSKYTVVEDKTKGSDIINYTGYFNKLININKRTLSEISSIGLQRQLRLIVKEKMAEPVVPVTPDVPNVNPETTDEYKWVQNTDGTWNYKNTDENSKIKDQWKKIDNKWYLFDKDGTMLESQWVKSGENWYWLESNGSMSESEWIYVAGSWFYAHSNGVIAESQWIFDNGSWFYAKAGGYIAENEWIYVDGKWYYAKTGGYIAQSETIEINKTIYSFDNSCAWIEQ